MSKSDSRLTLGRRDLLKAGLGGAAGLAAGLARGGQGVGSLEHYGADDSMRSPKYRIIDTHNHPRWIGYDGAHMIKNMDASGIERTWLISWELPERELSPGYYAEINPMGTDISFRDVIELVERYPDRLIPGTTVDPRDPHAHQKLKAAVDIFHVRVFGEFKLRVRYDDPDVIRLFHYAGELGLPVVLHLDATFPRHGVPSERQWWYGGGIENLEEPLKLCPHTQILGHGPAFWREISADADQAPPGYPKGRVVGRGRILEFLDRFPNLHCDLSGGSGYTALSRDPEFTHKFLTDYQDRLCFARDEFSHRLYDLLDSMKMPDAIMSKILRENALRLVPV